MTFPFIEEFRGYLLNRQRSPLTLVAYLHDVDEFFQEAKKQPQECVRADIEAFSAHLRGMGRSAGTINRKVASVSTYFKAMTYLEKLSKNPCDGLIRARGERKLPDTLTQAEVLQMLAVKPSTPEIRRALLAVEFLYDTGLRIAELMSLAPESLDLVNGQALVRGKGNKQRLVILPPKLVVALRDWKGWEGATAGMIRTAIKTLAREAGIKKNVYPHLFRHSAATALLDNGCDIRVIQEMLGHASIQTTTIYAKVSPTHLRDSITKFHPNGGAILDEKKRA